MILLGLYIFFIPILVIVVVQFVIIFYIWNKLQSLNKKIDILQQTSILPPKVPETTQPINNNEHVVKTPEHEIVNVESTPTKTKKELVLEALQAIKEVEEDDLPSIMPELKTYFSDYMNGDYTKDLSSKDYFRFIDLRSTPEVRVVVIGDIHCDYQSLSAILLKLSVSEYDYFEKAIFVFLGDYLDRGSMLFEPLLLLKQLNAILGDRLIMLKGNHESVRYNKDKQQITTKVIPNQSCECLNEYCVKDQEFLLLFASFYSTLPIYAYIKTIEKNVLLTHAAIPRDEFLNSIHFDDTTGCIKFESDVPTTERLNIRNSLLKDMIWGDPSEYDEKIQVDNGRFEFGRKQFEQWMSHNHIDLMLRSHEEAAFGYKSFFSDRLFTIFSTGGDENQQTGYPNVEPAFAIIQNKGFSIDNSYIYQKNIDNGRVYVNLFTKQIYTEKQRMNFELEDEFICNESEFRKVKEYFQIITRNLS